MSLITEEILTETDSDVTIKFTSKSGRELTRTVNKVEDLTTEQLLSRWHRRMTMEYLKRPFRFKRPQDPI